MHGVAQYGRAVYQQTGGVNYLYFWTYADYPWHVGTHHTNGDAELFSNATTVCPEAARGWNYNSGRHSYAGGVDVSCPSPLLPQSPLPSAPPLPPPSSLPRRPALPFSPSLSPPASTPASPPLAVPPSGPTSALRSWEVIAPAIGLVLSFGCLVVAWSRRHRLVARLPAAWPRRHQTAAATYPGFAAEVRLELAADKCPAADTGQTALPTIPL